MDAGYFEVSYNGQSNCDTMQGAPVRGWWSVTDLYNLTYLISALDSASGGLPIMLWQTPSGSIVFLSEDNSKNFHYEDDKAPYFLQAANPNLPAFIAGGAIGIDWRAGQQRPAINPACPRAAANSLTDTDPLTDHSGQTSPYNPLPTPIPPQAQGIFSGNGTATFKTSTVTDDDGDYLRWQGAIYDNRPALCSSRGGGTGPIVPPGANPTPWAGCIPPGHKWNLVMDDEFTQDTALNTSIWQPAEAVEGPIAWGGPAYLDTAKSASFSSAGLSIANFNADGYPNNPDNLPGAGGIISQQKYGPGYFEARWKPGASHDVFWVQSIGPACSPIIAGTEDDIGEFLKGADYFGTGGSTVHWGYYNNTCAQEEGTNNEGIDPSLFHTMGMYWSPTTGKTFCADGVPIFTAPNATGTNPGIIIFDMESGTEPGVAPDPMVIQYMRYYIDGGPAQ